MVQSHVLLLEHIYRPTPRDFFLFEIEEAITLQGPNQTCVLTLRGKSTFNLRDRNA